MDIWTVNALLLFLAFFVPGFVALQVYGLFVGSDDLDFQKQLPAVIGYSALHYAVTGWIILVVPWGIPKLIAAYVVVLVLPIVWTPIMLIVRDPHKWRDVFFQSGSWKLNVPKTIQAMLKPERTPWDRVLVDEARFIRVRLKSGRFVGGYLAPGSVVSAYPCERAIYIADAFSINQTTGKFGDRLGLTGVLIQGSEIESLEIIDLQGDVDNV